ncbi:sugar kinase [Sphingobacterium griseoflavum]|uniref:2-dehydro-3-deoxygluconokinase n=1 Tax=Sphingobacterium griseoflavum TaxID=1474952 RepID=A0ABQ3HQQ5_9SPHI|nr:sugar kinase [Sphingobacterium griseoflavum]GHE23598.1 2-dehydro-3-deoxygluconokinase [Sphingobacterium griseoflavum]
MNRILSFGEILIRQQLLGTSFFDKKNNRLEIFPGGSEANVAASLAQMGNAVCYSSAFPENALSSEIFSVLQGLGIDTAKSVIQGDRIGSYLLMSANGLSKGEVIYDRKYSSFSQLTIDQLDIDALFEDINWFHWTALSPALNKNIAQLMESLLKNASERGIMISVDLNYRNKLWQYGQEPIAVMPSLVAYCDVIMGNIWAANKMLGMPIDGMLDRYSAKDLNLEAAEMSANEVFERYPRCKHLAYTFRFMDNPQHNLFYGTYHNRSANVHSKTLETQQVIDRIGSGDAFMAGLIHALINNMTPQEVVDTATAAGFHKLFIKGDFGDGQISWF